MPTAERSTQTREVTTTVEEEVVVLTLSLPEARALYAVSGAIVGPSKDDSQPRKHTDAIWDTLSKVYGVGRMALNSERVTATGTLRLTMAGRPFPF